jgi:hypothetical protein
MITRSKAASLGLVGLLLVAVSGCASEEFPIEATGDTGQCQELDTVWSGEPIDDIVPGSTLERTVRCYGMTMSDARLVGDVEIAFRCAFTDEGDSAVGECIQESVVTNDEGSWRDEDGTMTIVVGPGEPSRVVQDGIRIGSGGYDGLRFAYHVESDGDGYPWPISGSIDRAG